MTLVTRTNLAVLIVGLLVVAVGAILSILSRTAHSRVDQHPLYLKLTAGRRLWLVIGLAVVGIASGQYLTSQLSSPGVGESSPSPPPQPVTANISTKSTNPVPNDKRAASSTVPPIVKDPSTSVPKVRHAGEVTITNRYDDHLDLDAPKGDLKWGRDQQQLGDGVEDGPTLTNGFGIWNNGPLTAIASEGSMTPDYATCALAQYGNEKTDIGMLDKGTGFCIRTSAGRYASIVLRGEATPSQVMVKIIVWEKR